MCVVKKEDSVEDALDALGACTPAQRNGEVRLVGREFEVDLVTFWGDIRCICWDVSLVICIVCRCLGEWERSARARVVGTFNVRSHLGQPSRPPTTPYPNNLKKGIEFVYRSTFIYCVALATP